MARLDITIKCNCYLAIIQTKLLIFYLKVMLFFGKKNVKVEYDIKRFYFGKRLFFYMKYNVKWPE
jgi:hypothetical protein